MASQDGYVGLIPAGLAKLVILIGAATDVRAVAALAGRECPAAGSGSCSLRALSWSFFENCIGGPRLPESKRRTARHGAASPCSCDLREVGVNRRLLRCRRYGPAGGARAVIPVRFLGSQRCRCGRLPLPSVRPAHCVRPYGRECGEPEVPVPQSGGGCTCGQA